MDIYMYSTYTQTLSKSKIQNNILQQKMLKILKHSIKLYKNFSY